MVKKLVGKAKSSLSFCLNVTDVSGDQVGDQDLLFAATSKLKGTFRADGKCYSVVRDNVNSGQWHLYDEEGEELVTITKPGIMKRNAYFEMLGQKFLYDPKAMKYSFHLFDENKNEVAHIATNGTTSNDKGLPGTFPDDWPTWACMMCYFHQCAMWAVATKGAGLATSVGPGGMVPAHLKEA
eukprot:GFYU01013057.1.p1 GENE.GFYU01013057.1~~GFYU01013057.1.p1  ORF type:complete len:182 (-),score=48.13 GFYU01013057.1:108-653(-)